MDRKPNATRISGECSGGLRRTIVINPTPINRSVSSGWQAQGDRQCYEEGSPAAGQRVLGQEAARGRGEGSQPLEAHRLQENVRERRSQVAQSLADS